jgi:hypothetical protein
LNRKSDDNNHLGWGFGYAYRQQAWEIRKFSDMNWNENLDFFSQGGARIERLL